MKDLADKFVRVRLTRLDGVDLNLFEFDYDLTLMVFFLNAEGKIYARYGGRDALSADGRQSPAGLRYTMQSVLAMHDRKEKVFAPASSEKPKFIRDLAGTTGFGHGCVHCHQVKEILNDRLQQAGQWSRDMVWRYPLPESLGIELEIERGNVVKEIKVPSPAAGAGLKVGDVVQELNAVPIHSFADAQFALDRAPATGAIPISLRRGDRALEAKLLLPEGWRKTDISWRTSMRRLVASPHLWGDDLTTRDKKVLGLSANQLAFRQQNSIPPPVKEAGIRGGDIILGVDDQALEMDVVGFARYIQGNYLVGDRVTVNIIRDGKRLKVPLTFAPAK
jgi:membrane-associated protease RseP (regulator of RpoE activity)